MIKIQNLTVEVEGKEILKDFNLTVNKGEVHAIMGPNGSGKSTLSKVIAGKEGYEVVGGTIEYMGEDLLEMEPDERARAGVFLAFQYPMEIPGVTNANFLKAIINEKRKHQGLDSMPPADFLKMMKEKMKLVEMDAKFISRSVNDGFSGGEKKRNEIFQMAMLEPNLGILDETDSGLDIDALKIVSNGVNQLRNEENAFIVITHYQRLLNYIVPDYVHILYGGRIIESGDKSLALTLEDKGYEWVKEKHNLSTADV